jgi:hypothetical protein
MEYLDRNGKPLKVGDKVEVRHTTGRYGQTRTVVGRLESIDQYHGVTISGHGYITLHWTVAGNTAKGYYEHQDFEHGHENWVTILAKGN